MKIVFMGTPEFAVPCLTMLVERGYRVEAVVTQPDKKKGRGHKVSFCPVKEYAVSKGINVLQPDKVKYNREFIQNIINIQPDLIVTCAYGKILPKEILDIPQLGCINVHASLLPKYRGASPINKVIIDGEKITGITTMLTDIGMDTGDILLQEEVQISENMTAGELHDILSIKGANVLERTLEELQNNTLSSVPQDDNKSCYAGMMDKNMGKVDWSKTNEEIHNLVRGTNPWPVAFTYYNGKKLKIWKTVIIHKECNKQEGTIVEVTKEGMDVCTGSGILRIMEIQAESSRRMTVDEYTRGHKIIEGNILGEVNC